MLCNLFLPCDVYQRVVAVLQNIFDISFYLVWEENALVKPGKLNVTDLSYEPYYSLE